MPNINIVDRWEHCKNGIKCTKCHTTVERLYHPDKYKRISCDGQRCNNSSICAFYHSSKERTKATKESRNYKKKNPNRGLLDTTKIHKGLRQYYEEAKSRSEQKQQTSRLEMPKPAPYGAQEGFSEGGWHSWPPMNF